MSSLNSKNNKNTNNNSKQDKNLFNNNNENGYQSKDSQEQSLFGKDEFNKAFKKGLYGDRKNEYQSKEEKMQNQNISKDYIKKEKSILDNSYDFRGHLETMTKELKFSLELKYMLYLKNLVMLGIKWKKKKKIENIIRM